MLFSPLQKFQRKHPIQKGFHIFPQLMRFHVHFESLHQALVNRSPIMPPITEGAYECPHFVETVKSVGSRIKKECAILLFSEHKVRVKGI
jgi:hypothetical protein